MRPDLGKVLTERPRRGGGVSKGGRRKQRARMDPESAPVTAPLRYRDERTKDFSDLIGPLRRLLLKNVGRPWDKVRSEAITAMGGSGGTLQRHLLLHLDGYVDTHVHIIDGEPCTRSTYVIGGWVPVYSEYSRSNSLYEHPKTGILTIAKPVKPSFWKGRR